MIDLVDFQNGQDLGVSDTVVGKAGNIISTQLETLEYAPTFGVDLEYFLQDSIQFQNASFKSYLVERLTQHQVNVTDVIETIETFTQKFAFSVGDANENYKGLIR